MRHKSVWLCTASATKPKESFVLPPCSHNLPHQAQRVLLQAPRCVGLCQAHSTGSGNPGTDTLIHLCTDIWALSKNRGGPPKWMVYNGIPEYPIKMDDLGRKPTIFGNIHINKQWKSFENHIEETWYSLGWGIFLLMIPTVRMLWWKSLGWSSQKCTMSFRWSGSLWRHRPYLPSILKTPQLKTQVQVPRLHLFVSTMFIPFLRLKNSLFHHFRVPYESKKSHMVI